jgi:hypothetical protein
MIATCLYKYSFHSISLPRFIVKGDRDALVEINNFFRDICSNKLQT